MLLILSRQQLQPPINITEAQVEDACGMLYVSYLEYVIYSMTYKHLDEYQTTITPLHADSSDVLEGVRKWLVSCIMTMGIYDIVYNADSLRLELRDKETYILELELW